MPTTTLSPGPQWTISQNVVYALPPSRCLVFTDATTPAIEVADSSSFATKIALTFTNGQAEVAGGFLRSTGALDISIIVKKF